VGSADGVPVPNAQGGFKKDAGGQIVLSRLDQALLTRMALATGGSYVQSVAGDMDLEAIYRDQIRAKLDTATVESGRKQVWADRFQWPLSLAVALLLAAAWVPVVKRPLAALALALLLLTPGAPVQAGPLQQGYQHYQQGDYDKALQKFIQGQLQAPDDPSVLYDLGNTYYKKGDFDAAANHYGQALSGPDETLKPKILYNLGNSAYRQGKLEKAIENYEAALKLAPDDQQAKENLTFVKKRLEQQQQQKQQNKGEQKPGDNPDQQPGQSGQQPDQNQGEQQGQQGQGQQTPPPQYGSKMNPPPSEPPQGQGQAQPPQQEPPAEDQNGSPQSQTQPGPPGQPAAAQMLNRLKDQPGKAMMPAYQKRPVDKDW
jgi:Ca-activated chloride channel homolog